MGLMFNGYLPSQHTIDLKSKVFKCLHDIHVDMQIKSVYLGNFPIKTSK